jgi:hypothetical protein
MATDTVNSEHNADPARPVSEGPERAFVYRLLHTLVFPIAVVTLAVLYVENTYGSLDLESLTYPYFAIGLLMVALSVTVGKQEWSLWDEHKEIPETHSFTDSVRNAVEENKLGLAILIILSVYVPLISILGFLIASLLTFFAVARTLSDDSYLRTMIWMFATVGIIYGLFVMILGIRAPTGIFGI